MRYMHGWDHPETAARYAAFCAHHLRYAHANAALIERMSSALVATGPARLLDFGAGTGETTLALRAAFPEAEIACVEPASSMRSVGEARTGPNVHWHAALPGGSFDAIVSGAALWQVEDLDSMLASFAERLRGGGVLAFTIPALYLGVPDVPGGGPDPSFVAFHERLARERVLDDAPAETTVPGELRTEEHWRFLLERAGFDFKVWSFEHRLETRELRDWLAIPVLTDRLLAHMPVASRDRVLDEALGAAGDGSFIREGWRVFVGAKTR